MTDEDSAKLLQKSSTDSKEELRDFLENIQSMPDIDENMEPDYLETRKALRFVNHDIEVLVKVIDLFKAGKYEKFALFDVSSYGARIRMDRRVKIGKKLALQFIFNDQTKYFLQARIVREEGGADEFIYGIQFEQENALLSEKLVQNEFKNDDASEDHVKIKNTPDAFAEAINTFFSLEERLYIKKNISTK